MEYHFRDKLFLGFNLRISFNCFLSNKTKRKGHILVLHLVFYFEDTWVFFKLFIVFKTGSEILRFSVISTKLLSILRFWVMLLKKVLKVSASS